jgi:hypothetical protein
VTATEDRTEFAQRYDSGTVRERIQTVEAEASGFGIHSPMATPRRCRELPVPGRVSGRRARDAQDQRGTGGERVEDAGGRQQRADRQLLAAICCTWPGGGAGAGAAGSRWGPARMSRGGPLACRCRGQDQAADQQRLAPLGQQFPGEETGDEQGERDRLEQSEQQPCGIQPGEGAMKLPV